MQECKKVVRLQGSSEQNHEAELHYVEWTQAEVKSRALKRTTKILGLGFLICLLILFIPGVHWSLLFLVPGLLLSSVPLYLKFSREASTFSSIQGKCPQCQTKQILKPYLAARFEQRMRVICSACGQISTALALE